MGVLQMQTAILFSAKDFGFFKNYVVSSVHTDKRGGVLSQSRHGEKGDQFFMI